MYDQFEQLFAKLPSAMSYVPPRVHCAKPAGARRKSATRERAKIERRFVMLSKCPPSVTAVREIPFVRDPHE